jgi:anti-anti-sigma factor
MGQIEFDTGLLPSALVARPSGDVDMAVTPAMLEELLAAVGEHGAGCLVIDLGRVDYIDSSGIELLFRVHGALTGESVDLIVVAPPSSSAARLLGMVALDDIGEIRGSLAEALQTCGEPEAH